MNHINKCKISKPLFLYFGEKKKHSSVFTLRYTEITNYISAEYGCETELAHT